MTNKYTLIFFLGCILVSMNFQFANAQLQMPNLDNSDVKAKVESLFADTPEMIAVAKCESGFRQYSGYQALRGGNGSYIGVFQISEILHAEKARALGFDIYTTDGNLGYAKYLYAKNGISPWIGCVKNPADAPTPTIAPTIPTATTTTDNLSTSTSSTTLPTSTPPTLQPSIPTTLPPSSTIPLTSNLQMGMAGPQVLTLQKLLNALGYTIATSGPGSAGNETTQFGKLTRLAIMQFQCKNNITCEGNESTTGYGRFGPFTRKALLMAAENLPK